MKPLHLALVAAALLVPASAQARTIQVHKGDSIQAAVDRAHPGDRIVVHPGTYHEAGTPCAPEPQHECAVDITRNHIRLLARPRRHHPVVLEAVGDQDDGIGVGTHNDGSCLTQRSKRVHGAYISGFTVRGFQDDGVVLSCVDHYRVTRVRAIDNHEYGIFPVRSLLGRVDHSFASGANDTGIYIGQSHRGRVDHNRAKDNVSGFEIENSTRIRADHNRARGNTAGLLSFALPNLDVKFNRRNEIDHNRLSQNDRPNTCLDPDDEVCKVPRGTGILVLAADRNLVSHNRVTGNDSYGIAAANYCIALSLSASDCNALDTDPDPDHDRVVSNRVLGNGGNPDPSVPSVFTVDLAWDGSGDGNCWSGNVAGTTFPPSLSACP